VAVDLHIHDADYCVSVWGKPQDIIVSAGPGDHGSSTALHSWWTYRKGPQIQFESVWEPAGKAPFFFGFKVTMECGTIIYDSRNQQGLMLATDKSFHTVSCEQQDPYFTQDSYFVDCLLSNTPVQECPPEESLLALRCVTEGRHVRKHAGPAPTSWQRRRSRNSEPA